MPDTATHRTSPSSRAPSARRSLSGAYPVRPELEAPTLVAVAVDHAEALVLTPDTARALARALTDTAGGR